MNLVLHPRAAPAGTLRIWVGAFQATSPPALSWFIGDAPATPVALRVIASVRPDSMLGTQPSKQPRAFTGVYEFSGLQPDTAYTVRVESSGIAQSLRTHTLPTIIPSSLDGSFNVLLVSCFHQAEDRGGLAGTIVSQLSGPSKPHLTLLMGDQVYLDLPTLRNFREDEAWLANKFEEDYTRNWSGSPGYGQVLDSAPNISIPDDHEFWNNFPHVSPMIQNSFHQNGRNQWTRAAVAMLDGFQRPYPAALGEPSVLDIDPLSFFIPDMRTLRDPERTFTMPEAAHQRMQQWVDDVITRRRFGVVVTGQSLYSEPMSWFTGATADYELPNYGDFGRFSRQLQRLADAGLPALCLTGDVHWGRITETVDVRSQRRSMYEIIASPSSLVTTVGADTISQIGGWFSGLFGKPKAWPRHSDAANPPDFLASEALAGRFRNKVLYKHRGNHVVLLKFARHGTGVIVEPTYLPISTDRVVGAPVVQDIFQLRTT